MEITVALGGGGTRGAAHIGVLRVLLKNGYSIRAISGTSIGSMVAVFFAFGFAPDEIEDIFSKVDQARLFGWPLSEGAGLLGVRGIQEFLIKHLGKATFDDLKIPCSTVAIDLNSNREIFINNGPVVDAILGSIAVPGLFPPRIIDGYRLIDGGTLDPIPVRIARIMAPGIPVVAVSLMSPLETPSSPLGILSMDAVNPLAKQLSRMNITQAFKVFADSIDIASRQMAELRLGIDKPAVIIRPDVNGINLLDRVDVKSISRRGEIATNAILPELKEYTSLKKNVARKIRQVFKYE